MVGEKAWHDLALQGSRLVPRSQRERAFRQVVWSWATKRVHTSTAPHRMGEQAGPGGRVWTVMGLCAFHFHPLWWENGDLQKKMMELSVHFLSLQKPLDEPRPPYLRNEGIIPVLPLPKREVCGNHAYVPRPTRTLYVFFIKLYYYILGIYYAYFFFKHHSPKKMATPLEEDFFSKFYINVNAVPSVHFF